MKVNKKGVAMIRTRELASQGAEIQMQGTILQGCGYIRAQTTIKGEKR
jgi:hypothetical protein